MKTIKTIH